MEESEKAKGCQNKTPSLNNGNQEMRREFIKKYGKLAAVTPVALMLAMNSQAQDSAGGGDGGPF